MAVDRIGAIQNRICTVIDNRNTAFDKYITRITDAGKRTPVFGTVVFKITCDNEVTTVCNDRIIVNGQISFDNKDSPVIYYQGIYCYPGKGRR